MSDKMATGQQQRLVESVNTLKLDAKNRGDGRQVEAYDKVLGLFPSKRVRVGAPQKIREAR